MAKIGDFAFSQGVIRITSEIDSESLQFDFFLNFPASELCIIVFYDYLILQYIVWQNRQSLSWPGVLFCLT
jgi:hypothetical protein